MAGKLTSLVSRKRVLYVEPFCWRDESLSNSRADLHVRMFVDRGHICTGLGCRRHQAQVRTLTILFMASYLLRACPGLDEQYCCMYSRASFREPRGVFSIIAVT